MSTADDAASTPATGIERVTVVGAGIMGGGIARVMAGSGFDVTLFDPAEDARARAAERVARSLEPGDAATRFHLAADLGAAVSDAQLVIEAVPERLELKRSLFAELDVLAPADSLLATNTSELSVTAIAAATGRAASVLGMHWFNPPERMRLIELVRAVQTSDATVRGVQAVAARCGKTTVTVLDRQGFVTTRLLAAAVLEGIRMLEEGVASAEDIDTAVRLGLNHPMGPLELADYVGLDTMALIAESMADGLGERFRAPQSLRKLVEAGRHGRKAGIGFYAYDGDGRKRDG